MKYLALVALPLALLSCTRTLYRDETVDLKQLTPPDPVTAPAAVAPAAPLVPPAQPPIPVPEVWRAWVPRQVQPNGDVIEGHYLTLSLTEPALEALEPEKPMPRVPHGATLKVQPPVARPAVPPGATPQMPWSEMGVPPGREPLPPAAWRPPLPGQPFQRAPGTPGYPSMGGE